MSATKAPSLKGRFAAAIALTIGFYILAIGLAVVLIGLPVLIILNGGFNLWVTITGLFLGGSILFAAFPRRMRFSAPGVRVDRAAQPKLVELIDEEARALDEDPPHEVYVTMEVNAAGEEDTSPPASELITDTEAIEREVARFLFGGDAVKLEPIDWSDAGERVYVPHYEELVADRGWILEGVTFATLPDAVARIGELAGRLQSQQHVPAEDAPELAAAVLGAGGVLALRGQGWSVSALPGRPVLCWKGERDVAPHMIVAAARVEDFDVERCRADARELGVEDVSLEPARVTSPA